MLKVCYLITNCNSSLPWKCSQPSPTLTLSEARTTVPPVTEPWDLLDFWPIPGDGVWVFT